MKIKKSELESNYFEKTQTFSKSIKPET